VGFITSPSPCPEQCFSTATAGPTPATQPNKNSGLADERRDIHDRLHGIVLASIFALI
jgi:hypothetical protein